MKRLVLALIVLLLPLGCGNEANEPGTLAPQVEPEGVSADVDVRKAAIYSAVVRQLVTRDHTVGNENPGFRVIYVLDGEVADAGTPDPPTMANPKEPFSQTLRAEMERSLSDLPPLEFVARRDSVVVGTNGNSAPGEVKGGGVLLSLGPVQGGGKTVRVGNSLWVNGLWGQWLTYVVEKRAGVWKVAGTTGPVAIS